MKKIFKFTLFLFLCTFLFVNTSNAETGALQFKTRTKFMYKYKFAHETRTLYCEKQLLKGTNHPMYNFQMSHNTLEPLYDISLEDIHADISLDNVSINISKEEFENLRKTAYYGDIKYNTTKDELDYLVTNGLLIKALNPDSFEYYKYDGYTKEAILEKENTLKDEIDAYFVKPSFDSEELELVLNESLTISDKNNVLETYRLARADGDSVSYEIVDNKIVLKALKPGTTTFTFKKEYNEKDYNMEFLYREGQRAFALSAGNFTLYSSFSIKVNGGRIVLNILDDEEINNQESLDATYGIYNQEDKLVYQINTNIAGIFYTDYLPYGNYYIKEISNSSAYIKNDNIYKVNLDSDLSNTVNILNHKKKNDIVIKKPDNKLEDSSFDKPKDDSEQKEKLRKVVISFLDEDRRIINDAIKFSIMDKSYQSSGKNTLYLKDGNYLIEILEVPSLYIWDNKNIKFDVVDDTNIEIILKYKEEGYGSEVVDETIDTVDISVPNTFSFNYLFIFVGLRYVKKFSKW